LKLAGIRRQSWIGELTLQSFKRATGRFQSFAEQG